MKPSFQLLIVLFYDESLNKDQKAAIKHMMETYYFTNYDSSDIARALLLENEFNPDRDDL